MNNILTVSVHTVGPAKQGTRAFLWRGRLSRHDDSEIFFAESSHQNFFVAVQGLKESVWRWKKDHCTIDAQVGGVDTAATCWPLDPTLRFRENLMENLYPKGLLIAPVSNGTGGWLANLFALFPLPSQKGLREAAYQLSVWNENIFQAAEELERLAKRRESERLAKSVAGLHDQSPCWPKGF